MGVVWFLDTHWKLFSLPRSIFTITNIIVFKEICHICLNIAFYKNLMNNTALMVGSHIMPIKGKYLFVSPSTPPKVLVRWPIGHGSVPSGFISDNSKPDHARSLQLYPNNCFNSIWPSVTWKETWKIFKHTHLYHCI